MRVVNLWWLPFDFSIPLILLIPLLVVVGSIFCAIVVFVTMWYQMRQMSNEERREYVEELERKANEHDDA
ncbi:MAG: hypothetical protein OXH76_05570 [Boseongicola sp.]|nr:hypothetical protein [Boseongicola sp.]